LPNKVRQRNWFVKGLWIVIVVEIALKAERPAKRAFLLI
jgi:hypothetical protein